MKKALLCLFAVAAVLLCVLAFPQTAQAASANDLYFDLNETGDGYIVSGCYSYASGNLVIPETYDGLPVVGIGKAAFSGCGDLTGITIPDSVTFIDSNAFWNCYGLTSITIPKNVTSIGAFVFSNCFGLSEINVAKGNPVYHSASNCIIETATKTLVVGRDSSTIPTDGSVTGLGATAFSGCSFASFTIPQFITNLYGNPFMYCHNLYDLQVEKGNSAYYSINNCVIETASKTLVSGCASSNIPSDGSVTSIGTSAFEGCSGLTSIAIPKTVVTIDYAAFWNCDTLSNVTLANGLKTIGDEAFKYCSSLTNIILPSSVTSVGYKVFADSGVDFTYYRNAKYLGTSNNPYYVLVEAESQSISSCNIHASTVIIADGAFEDCYGLSSITIPDGVIHIGDYAFYGCQNLAKISIPDSVISIDYLAFARCNALTEVVIPDSVTDLGGWVFNDCLRLSRVILPSGITYISEGLFALCANLSDVTIPESVTNIGVDAFNACGNLASITIPEGVTSIGDGAFSWCARLVNVIIPEGVDTIGADLFEECISLISVSIPDSVTNIGEYAFYNCTDLETVIFCGTQNQWAAVEIAGGNEVLNEATVQYHNWIEATCTEPATCKYCGEVNGSALGHDMQVIVGKVPSNSIYSVYSEELDTQLIFSLEPPTDGNGEIAMRDMFGFPTSYDAAKVATYLATNYLADSAFTVEVAATMEGKTLAEIKADETMKAAWDALIGWWQTEPNEELHFFLSELPEPTCETTGKNVVWICANHCGKTEGGTEIPALGHNMQETTAAVEPTCTAAGATAILTCANGCGKTEGGEEIAATGHNYVDGTCACGAADPNTPTEPETPEEPTEPETPEEPEVMLGDADGNGKINLRDAILVLKAINGGGEVDASVADVDGSGKVNLRDAILILKYSNGTPFPEK